MEEEFDDTEDTDDTDVRDFLSGLFTDTELTEYNDDDKDLIREFLGIKDNNDGSDSV